MAKIVESAADKLEPHKIHFIYMIYRHYLTPTGVKEMRIVILDLLKMEK